MAKKAGKGFSGIFDHNPKDNKETLSVTEMEKIHCDIPKSLKYKVDLFKVKHSITVKDIVNAALTEYIKKRDLELFESNQ